MRNFFIALQFLTILPVKIKAEKIKERNFGKSLFYFPLVGFLIGSVLGVVALFFGFLPPSVKSAIILITSCLVTGALHLDGFADTCDGLYGNRSREERLRIMKDSHIGTMGVVGIVCILLLKFALIANIALPLLFRALIIMAVFSRWSVSWACSACSCAREKSKARFFMEYADKRQILINGVFVFVLSLVLAGLRGILVFFSAFICVNLFRRYVEKKISGMTGDTLGAVNEIAEAGVLFFMMLYFR